MEGRKAAAAAAALCLCSYKRGHLSFLFPAFYFQPFSLRTDRGSYHPGIIQQLDPLFMT